MAGKVPVQARLKQEDVARIKRIVDSGEARLLPEFQGEGEINYSSILRTATLRGLREMEAELLAHKGCRTTEAALAGGEG